MITIQDEHFAKTFWFAGEYEDEDGKVLNFTLYVDDSALGHSTKSVDWPDEWPGGDDAGRELIEAEIIKQYEDRIK